MLEPSFLASLGVALSISVPAIAASIAIITCGTAMATAGMEKPELLGRLMITVVLGEALAIYGLLIAFMLLSKLPIITTSELAGKALGAALSISISTIAAGAGISYCGSNLAGAVVEKPETFSMNVIAVVLSEALAIYGLLISFMLIAQIA